MKTYTMEELSQKVKKIIDLHSHMNTAWPKLDEQNLHVAIMAGIQDAYVDGQKVKS